MSKLNITICGCGNGAHSCTALLSRQGHNINIYSPIKEEIDNFIRSGNYLLNATLPDKTVFTTKLNIITSEASEVIPDSSIVIIIVPAFAHENILRKIQMHISENTLVVIMPTRSGFEFEAINILPKCNIIGLQTLPWACRIKKFGSDVDIIGKKINIQAGAFPSNLSKVFLYQLEMLLDLKLDYVKNMLTLTLGNVGQIIHPGIMFGLFHNYEDETFSQENIPLFYQNVDLNIANILSHMSKEIKNIANKLYSLNNNIINPDEVLSIEEWIIHSYGEQILDNSSLDKMFSTNSAYQGLKVPVKQIENEKFMPDFNSRYIIEDIPYGLLVIKSIGEIINVETPKINVVIERLGALSGEDYLNLLQNTNKLNKISRIPLFYGLSDFEDMEKFYVQ